MASKTQLLAGESLGVNQKLETTNGARLIMQSDGNLVLYRTDKMKALWSSNTFQKGGVKATFAADGNLIIFDKNNKIVWQSNTPGHPWSVLKLQTDGNLVAYGVDLRPYWNTNTWNFEAPDSHDNWLTSAVKSAGKAINDVGDALGSIPAVGPLLHGVWGGLTGPLTTSIAIAKGERVDRAMVDHFTKEIANVQEIAPYAQMVISVVPGIGPVASAAISTGLALAQGKRIDEALLAGVKGALPGGALVSMAFDAGQAALSGKNIGSVVVAALPVPDVAKKLIGTGLDVAQSIASGKRVDSAVLDAAIAQLPPAAKKAADIARQAVNGDNLANILLEEGQKMVPGLTAEQQKMLRTGLATGMALGHGQKLQDVLAQQATDPTNMGKLGAIGSAVATATNAIGQARKALPPTITTGFDLGIGLMQHSGVTPVVASALRNTLPSEQKKGFDMGIALHAGHVLTPISKQTTKNPAANVAMLITVGMAGAPAANKVDVAKTLIEHPEMKKGVIEGVKTVNEKKASIVRRILHAMGFIKAL